MRGRRARRPAGNKDSERDPDELEILRAVVASLPDMIYVKDRESRFLMANQATAQAMGATCSQDLLGKTDFDFYPPELAQGFFDDEQRVIRTGKPLVSQDEHIKETTGQTRWLLTTKVPFAGVDGRALGIIGIGRNITSRMDLEAGLRKVQKELEFKATHDGLTELLNRGAIMEMLEREFARGSRTSGPTAVLMGDLDHFKNVNDACGHLVGDEVLREVARLLLHTVRPYDLVGRYGGEEFLVILSDCTAADALVRADQLRETIAATPVVTKCGPISMTISFGVLAAEGLGDLTLEEKLRAADVALYAAKAAGRNQCKMACPEP
ncbi:MAG: sensor domain-containing diguanylate cyclase [Terracidiphilus sp.]